jgi:tRNA pseudouridine38-40 synthase
MKRQFKIIVAYDGTDYYGWQAQKLPPTIAQTLQNVFLKVFNKKISFRVASRTDAGVHAQGQVATFSVDLDVEAQTMMRAWNNLLPQAIVIRSITQVPLGYNPHKHVIGKTYWYHVFVERPLPFHARYGWYYPYRFDSDKVLRCLKTFLGTHDFRAFSTGDDRGDDTIRTINNVDFTFVPEMNAYKIAITGPKFLHYMVRRMVGACLHIARHESMHEDLIKKVLQDRNPDHILPNAPAQGLTLYTIEYSNEEISLDTALNERHSGRTET